jgi:uncharacterized membrane protein YebE (DUF533 family)
MITDPCIEDKVMKDLNGIISGLSKSGLISGFAGGIAGGALSGALMSKKGRNIGSSVLKVGALAAIGGIAYKAYQAYSQKNSAQQAFSAPSLPKQDGYTQSQHQPNLTYTPNSLSEQQFKKVVNDDSASSGQMLLLRAMITAANADGHIDEGERKRIYEQVDQLDLSIADKASLFDELRSPLSLDALVNAVPNSETAVEVYAASVLAIDHQQPASEHYLHRLAQSLMIPCELVSAIHQQTQSL